MMPKINLSSFDTVIVWQQRLLVCDDLVLATDWFGYLFMIDLAFTIPTILS